MPLLEDVEYSQAEAVEAVRGYYTFLTNMYLDSSRIAEPPSEDGWPDITPQRFQTFAKTTEVLDLLRHLPYITGAPLDFWGQRPHAGPHIQFHDYTRELGYRLNRPLNDEDGEDLRLMTEDLPPGQVPSHVVGLKSGDSEGSFLLDTKLGIIHWTDCPTEIQYKIRVSKQSVYPALESEDITGQSLQIRNGTGTTGLRSGNNLEALNERIDGFRLQGSQDAHVVAAGGHGLSEDNASSSTTSPGPDEQDPDIIEQILDDAYMSDWWPEVEQDWRGDSGKWTIPDFFEVLKLHFRALDWVPISDRRVMDVWSAAQDGKSRMLAEVQAIWREHGWPTAEALGTFDKVACLAHVRRFLCERYPDVGEILDMYP